MIELHMAHPSWHPLLKRALAAMAPDYLAGLVERDWLPGPQRLLAAFSQPRSQVQAVLLGESPYPRPQSANGYAFWDGAVGSLWSPTGLAKPVNRATSLRNMIKMLLVARGDLAAGDCSQGAIAQVDKTPLVNDLAGMFDNLLQRGFLLLNASLVWRERPVVQEARAWRPFMDVLLEDLQSQAPQLLLFGRIAQALDEARLQAFPCLQAEHPYNISFIHNPAVLEFFRPLDVLRR